jgi:hypothetical protein
METNGADDPNSIQVILLHNVIRKALRNTLQTKHVLRQQGNGGGPL